MHEDFVFLQKKT